MGCGTSLTKENIEKLKYIPDKNYDFLIKKQEQKDLLDIYKPKNIVRFSSEIKCPLCKIILSDEENSIIENKLNIGGECKLWNLINDFNKDLHNEWNKVDSPEKIDNISELENIYNQIQNYFKIIEENRFYKHICKRTNNQEIYIDLCTDYFKDNLEKILYVDINKLKLDKNYKNKYLESRRISYFNYIKQMKKKEIENKYKDEFESITLRKDEQRLEFCKYSIQNQYEDDLRRKQQAINTEYCHEIIIVTSASQFFSLKERSLLYSAAKKKLKEFIENLTGENIYHKIYIEPYEKEEFKAFILEREPEYSELLIDNY
jgi:hypothetical protein